MHLIIDGLVDCRLELSLDDLAAIDARQQIADVGRFDPKRRGDAVRLAGLLALARPQPVVRWITLHAAADDFHASIPLDRVRDRAIVIYRVDGGPLPAAAGGPFRFFIPDHLACRAAEIDECANVKFVDRIELTADRGHDNRPHDDAAHAQLHLRQ